MLIKTLRDKRVIKGKWKEKKKKLNKVILLESCKSGLSLFSEFQRCNTPFHISAALFFQDCINVNANFSNCDNKEESLFEQTVCVLNCFLDFMTTTKK